MTLGHTRGGVIHEEYDLGSYTRRGIDVIREDVCSHI